MSKFGKVDFATSLNPTSAFPLDGRVVFDTFDEAKAAAKSAKEIGSTESRYYYGMKLLVTDSNKWYKITKSGALEEEGSGSGSGVGINWRGEFLAGAAYNVNDVVSYNGSSYICIKAVGLNDSHAPTDTEYWSLLAKRGDNGSGADPEAITNEELEEILT